MTCILADIQSETSHEIFNNVFAGLFFFHKNWEEDRSNATVTKRGRTTVGGLHEEI